MLKGGKFKTILDEVAKKATVFILHFAFDDFQSCSFSLPHLNEKNEIECIELMDLTTYINERT